MTPLEIWITQATRQLSADSTAKVRTEIQEHYEAARDAAMSAGSTEEAVDRLAVTALGDAKTANRQYRQVLLTADEARLMGLDVGCGIPWMRVLMIAVPVALLMVSLVFLLEGNPDKAKGLLEGAIGVSVWTLTPFLPIYTPGRARFVRFLRWAVLLTAIGMVYHWSWMFISCLWPVISIELTKNSIRRKTPLAQWPKQLYL
jgi:hypothetical protein